MIINAANLQLLYKTFNTAFQSGFGAVATHWERIATLVPSSTRENHYGWLGDIPGLREWIGDRHVHGLKAHGYSLVNKPYELTIGVNRDDIDDDNLGIYTPRFQMMGDGAARHPDSLVWALLVDGFITACYDGQNFFDAEHPVGDALVANFQDGAGNPWFLLDTTRPLKPLIFQRRKDYGFTAMTREDDEQVFMRKEYRYGVDARVNVGFGFWQMAWASKETLDAANFEAGLGAMMGFSREDGSPLGIMPNLLVVGRGNRSAAKRVIDALLVDGGDSNINYKAVEVLVVPWLP